MKMPFSKMSETRCLHAIIVISDCWQAVFRSTVAIDVDDVASNPILAELVGREKTRPGIIRLVAKRAIEFGGVPEALVNRQREMRSA